MTCWMQHLVIEIRQGGAITVARTLRLSPNCHLGISTTLADLIIQMLVKARKEGIVRHLRDAVSTQQRTARRPCLNSIANSAYFKFYSQSLAFNVPLSWTLLMLQFSPFLFSSSSMHRPSCVSQACCSPPPAVLLLPPGTLPPLCVVASVQLWRLFCLVFASISASFSMSFRSSSSRLFRTSFPRRKTDMMVVKSWKYFWMINFPDAWSILFIAPSPNRGYCVAKSFNVFLFLDSCSDYFQLILLRHLCPKFHQ